MRLILKDAEGKFLLTREFRSELNSHDYRLPGGKVYDTLREYLTARGNTASLQEAVMCAAKLEAKQETGVDEIRDLRIFTRSTAGASIEWDLYYLTGIIAAMGAQELEEDELERGIDVGFYTREQVLEMLRRGDISESRTVGVLFRYLLP